LSAELGLGEKGGSGKRTSNFVYFKREEDKKAPVRVFMV